MKGYEGLVEVIKFARIKAKFTQTKLAGLIGIDRGNYAKRESGILIFKFPELIKILNILPAKISMECRIEIAKIIGLNLDTTVTYNYIANSETEKQIQVFIDIANNASSIGDFGMATTAMNKAIKLIGKLGE